MIQWFSKLTGLQLVASALRPSSFDSPYYLPLPQAQPAGIGNPRRFRAWLSCIIYPRIYEGEDVR